MADERILGELTLVTDESDAVVTVSWLGKSTASAPGDLIGPVLLDVVHHRNHRGSLSFDRAPSLDVVPSPERRGPCLPWGRAIRITGVSVLQNARIPQSPRSLRHGFSRCVPRSQGSGLE